MGKGDGSLGGKHKTLKIPNARKKNAKDVRDKGPIDTPAAQIDEKGEFGDKSTMSKDWRLVPTILGDVLKQKREVCWAISLSRLLQAAYNVNLENKKSFLEFMYEDLVEHLMPKEKGKKTAKLELKNIKKAIAHIKDKGLLTVGSSRSNKAGGPGHHETWDFKIEKNAEARFIREKLVDSPVAVCFHIDNDFHALKEGIYRVKNLNEEGESHMVLVVGYGYTEDNRLFFLIQNSWGTIWGVNGYGRIIVDENSGVTVIYP